MYPQCKTVKRKRSKRQKLFIALISIGAVFAAVTVFIKYNVTPVIVSFSREKIRALTNDAVSNAILEVMSDAPDREYLKITRDEKQNIKSVEIDGAAVSDLAHKITLATHKYINRAGSDGIKIPIGSLSGIALFTGLGPELNVKIYLVGSTHTKIISVFTESGINQTVHKLFFDISGDIAVAIPGISSIKTSAQVLMSETIIIGEVPQTYLHAATVGDMLDLAA